ncbi:hypothetical protein BJV82DRAFT_664613 [Fennellomyces sp. T-0311]|nr:hypothetical protein BJV82DRAFT_664613 [Fennellomyces sp. T-0311]
MKFSLISAATLAIAGVASAAYCEKSIPVPPGLTCQQAADLYNVDLNTILNNQRWTEAECDAKIKSINSICVQAPRTKAKRCLAEKKAAAEKAAAEKKAAEEKAVAEEAPVEEEEPAVEEEPAAEKEESSSSSGAPSAGAVSAADAKAQGLRIVNKANPNCKWFYVITAADTGCEDVATKNGIDVETLYDLNKNLHRFEPNTCDNLDDGKAYCVGI